MKQILTFHKLKTGLFLCLFLGTLINTSAQVNSYSFTQSAGTYTEITGGTIVATATGTTGTASLDGVVYDLPAGTIPFTFNFDNTGYTGCKISTNCFITFGSISPAASGTTTGYAPLSAVTGYNGAIAALGRRNNAYFFAGVPAQTGQIRYQVLGSAPNRTFVIQWKNFKTFNTSGATFGAVLNFQIRLSETSNAINIVYNSSGTYSTSPCQVGLRGANNSFPTNINNRSVVNGVNTWLTSSAGVSNSSTCELLTGLVPPAGLTYTFAPLSCPAPQNLGTTNVTQTAAQLTWTTTGGGGTFKVEWGLSGFTPGNGTIVNNAISPLSISGLTASTNYQFYVQQNCGGSGTSINTGPFVFQSGGPGEDCSSAILVTVKTSLANCGTYTVVNSGNSQNGPTSVCSDATGNLPNDDRWLKFVAPSNGKKIVIYTTAGTVNDWVMQVWKTCSGNPIDVVKCADDDNAFMPQITLCQNEYIAGQTYYIRAWTYSQTVSGNMNLCVYEDTPCPIPPSNDECVFASTLIVNQGGACPANALTFTNKDATSSASAATCDAGSGQKDVYFLFNTDIYGDLKIVFSKITATNLKAQVLFDCTGSELFCWNPADGAAKNITGLNPNADYILRVWSDSIGTGTFSVCISDACSNPTATLSGTQSICPGGTAQLYVDFTGSAPFTFSYSDGSVTTPVVTSSNPYSLLVNPPSTRTYSLISFSDATCNGTISGTATVTVATPPTVTLANFNPVCSNGGLVSLSGGNPGGGVYSGTGVNGGTFNPSAGTQTITYTVNFGIGCNRSASKVLTVNGAPTVTLASFADVCSNAGLVTLTGGSPSGGIYSGTGVSGGNFDPSIGSTNITYTYTNASGCSNSSIELLTVNPAPFVSLTPFSSVCNTTPPFALTGGTPTGGTYSGPGVSSGTFNPPTAGLGTKIITYSYTNASGCSSSDTASITVTTCGCANPATVSANGDKISCGLAGVSVTGTRGGSASSSSWATTGTGTFSPNNTALSITYNPSSADVSAGKVDLIITTNDPDGGGVCVAAKDTMKITFSSLSTGPITGSTGICAPVTGQVYSVAAQAGVTFTWTVPANVIIASGQGTNSITTNWTSTSANGGVCVTATGPCGTSAQTCKTVTKRTALPAAAGVITGPIIGCPGESKIYTIRKIATADLYVWTPPIGATINGSSSPFTTVDTIVTVTFTASFPSAGDTLRVSASNCRGTSAQRKLKISKTAPATPGVIAGQATALCNLSGIVYSIAPVTNATSYTWSTAIAGVTINGNPSPFTTTSTSVTLNFGSIASGTLIVTASNGCGTSANRTLTLTSTAPATPGVIAGTASGLCNKSSVGYSIVAVANATSYTWSTAIAGVTINGNPSPFTTASTSVTLNFGTFTTGSLVVKANNGCGSSANRTLALTSKPATPGVITGLTTVCVNTNAVAYSISAVVNATSYTWTAPSGAIIASGQGTTSVTVNFGATTGVANLIVVANGVACGNSANRTLSITRNTCPRFGENSNNESLEILNVYPNPTQSIVNVLFNSFSDKPYYFTLVDVQGKLIIEKMVNAVAGQNTFEMNLGKVASQGIYSLRMQSADEVKQIKIVLE